MEHHEEDTQNCLAIEDNREALDCLKRVVTEYSGSDVCRPKLVLLVKKGCVPCAEETALRQADIDKGIVQKISIDTPEGLAIAAKNDITLIPSLVLLDCNDNIIEPD